MEGQSSSLRKKKIVIYFKILVIRQVKTLLEFEVKYFFKIL